MAWLTSFLTPFMTYPAMAAAGTFLVASPIVIHLINRMRFRRVRFAAMEFLLAAQQKNRRRLLIEQLILLLLRILIVLGIVALIARMVLNPSQMSVFKGAQTHHVVLLDDSGSMQDRWGDTNAFKEGLTVIRKLVGDGVTRPNSQRFSLILMSRPNEPVFVQENVNSDFATRMETKLENLESQPAYGTVNLSAALDEARKLLSEDKAVTKTLHVVSDFRTHDWNVQKAVAGSIEALDKAGVAINLVRTVPDRHANLAITELSGDVHVAATGVPLRLHVTVQNFGKEVAKDVRVSVQQDDQKLPLNIYFDKIDPGQTADREFDVVFDTATRHTIRVSLEADALMADNARYLAVDVPPKHSVLVIDGDPAGEEAFYVAASLAPDTTTTGFAPLVEGVDYLRRQPLHSFQCIYLLNVPEIAADGLEPLRQYVADGGGLVWFMGDLVKPSFYNEKLYDEGKGMFPVRLAAARRELPPDDGTTPGPDMVFGQHPVFERTFDTDNPFSELVKVSTYFPVADDWARDDNERKDGVRTIATLRNKQPVAFEHQFGKGRVITFLTSAGKMWNNWASGPGAPSFVVTQLELEKHVARQDASRERKVVGQPLEFALSPTDYLGDIEIRSPGQADVPVRLTAIRKKSPSSDGGAAVPPGSEAAPGEAPKPEAPKPETPREDDATAPLRESYAGTTEPGIYVVSLARQDDTKETRLYAFNVPTEEGDLELATNEDIRKRVGDDVRLEIQEAGNFTWIVGRENKHEIRTQLLIFLALILVAEQLMAMRLSYHPKLAGAAA